MIKANQKTVSAYQPLQKQFFYKVCFFVSTGCGTADEHTEHSAVAEWDAAIRSVHRAFGALPISMIRRAGLIQKLRILRSFSCNVKCDSVVCAADVGRQHSCLLRSFSCNAIFQFFNVTGSVHLTGSITILLRRSAYPYVHQLLQHLCNYTYNKVYFIITIESCKSLYEDVRKSQQNSCFTKMLTRRQKKSQQDRCLTKMLTCRQKKSQQNRCLTKMLTRRQKKSQQSSCLTKMLTRLQ